MAKEKILTPQTIENTPFPGEMQDVNFDSTQKTSNEEADPAKTKDQGFPRKTIATELLSVTLNTKSKKILGEFQFTESGAIQIGKFVEGESGDTRVSPNGIVTRNIDGEITFALDGDTGSAVFKGTVQAGSLISGSIIVGGKLNANGSISVLDSGGAEKVLIDKDGIVVSTGKIIVQDDSGSTVIDAKGLNSVTTFSAASVIGSGTQSTTSNSYQDATGVTINVTLARTQNVLIFGGVSGIALTALLDDDIPNCQGKILVGAVQVGQSIYTPGRYYETSGGFGVTATNGFTQEIVQLAAGVHTIKLQFRNNKASGETVRVWKDDCIVGYVVLGK